MITFNTPKHHWNYFLAIEHDLENLSRYIEFANGNLQTYSIELTHILLSASSEVDVVMKQLCSILDSSKQAGNINDYQNILIEHIPEIINEEVSINRFGLLFKPLENWNDERNPDWWKSYNNVKHSRNNYFMEANLKNTINAVGALLIVTIYYYKYAFSKEKRGEEIDFKETTSQLRPESSFLEINNDYYCHHLLVR